MILKKLCETLKVELDEDNSADFVGSVAKIKKTFFSAGAQIRAVFALAQ
jgi:hypothetical protein